MSKKRIFLICLILFFMIWFMCPIIGGVFHIGMIYPTLLLAIPLLCLIFPDKAKKLWNGKAKIFIRIITGCICAGVIALAGIFAVMVYAGFNSPDENSTVIVLGCQVRGEELSRMLKARANKALAYLEDNPQAVCVASGGQGQGESISEAEAIKRYLVRNGISEDRIFIEDKSTTTAENIEFSAKIIEENGLNRNVAIASDRFHQLRASIFASNNQLTASSLGSNTWIFLAPGYWTREALAVCKAVVFGN